MHILVLNGPNINLLGTREPDIYGHETYADLQARLIAYAQGRSVTLAFFQSNHEGDLVDAIQEARHSTDGIIINPAAYTHTSVALLDALQAVQLPTVEVHISDPSQREPFRHHSFVTAACAKTIAGHGLAGYEEALQYLLDHHLVQ